MSSDDTPRSDPERHGAAGGARRGAAAAASRRLQLGLRTGQGRAGHRQDAHDLVDRARHRRRLDYEAVYRGESPWRLLPPIDHPAEPTRCLVSGTGLTHLGSARNRQAMHTSAPERDDRQHEDVSLGARRRPSGARPDRDRPRVVLQGHGHDPARPRRAAGGAGVRRGWRRGGGDRRHLPDRRRRPAAPHRHGSRQRVLRPPLREEELSQPRGVQASHLRARPRAGGRSRLRVRARPR